MSGAANGITAAVVDRVMEAIAKAGLVEVEVSARTSRKRTGRPYSARKKAT